MDLDHSMTLNCRIRKQDRQLFWWRVACLFLASALAGSWAPYIAEALR